MKKGDIILLIVILVLGISGILYVKYFQERGKTVIISCDSQEIDRISLGKDGTYIYQGAYGKNIVEISDGRVCVSEADCPDRLCVKQGEISGSRETIICLPHRFVVEVE